MNQQESVQESVKSLLKTALGLTVDAVEFKSEQEAFWGFLFQDPPQLRIRVELGLVQQSMGNFRRAHLDFVLINPKAAF